MVLGDALKKLKLGNFSDSKGKSEMILDKNAKILKLIVNVLYGFKFLWLGRSVYSRLSFKKISLSVYSKHITCS